MDQDNFKYFKQERSNNLNSPFLILSHHRSGSNFLNNILQEHPKFECINEPLSMHTNIFRELDLKPWTSSEFNETSLHSDLNDYPDLIIFLKELRNWLVTPYDGHTRGLKETLLFEKLEWVKQFIPNLNIIFLVRDPRAVICSVLKKGEAYKKIWKYDQTIPEYTKKYLNIPGEIVLDPVHLTTWSWKIRTELTFRYKELFNHRVIKLEELILNTEQTLDNIMSFLGSELNYKQTEFIKRSHSQTRGKEYSSYRDINDVLSSWERKLSDADRHYIESNLREEMVRLGYL